MDEIDKASKIHKTRTCVYNNDEFAPEEESAPKNTPSWTDFWKHLLRTILMKIVKDKKEIK